MKPFSAFKIGNVTLSNRLVMAPVKTGYGDQTGEANYRHFSYYRRRAEGGVAAIIVEPLYIDPAGKEHPKQLGISSYNHIDGLKELVSAIHEGGSVAVAHLNHAGRAANPKVTGTIPEAPSEVPCPTTGYKPIAMSIERIQEIVQEYSGAARRAREAGFDIIEVQFGLGYLISQFFSARTNLRTDEYGGSLYNRARFGRNVLSAIRENIGVQFPLIARISATLTGDASDLKDAVFLAKLLEKEGVSALHVASGSACDSPPWYFQHMRLPAGKNLEWAAIIKKKVSIPVIAAGRLGDPTLIRESLTNEIIDGVALGRPLVADPDLPNKMKSGRDDDVFLCGACLQGCLMKVKSGEGLSCILNPEVGHEGELVQKAENVKKVVIVGGGPAGMQAALTIQNKGHQVILFDEGELGGKFNLAIIPPGKKEMKKPLDSMVRRIHESNIELHLGQHVTADNILDEHPEHVILATGSVSIIPEINGMEDAVISDDVLLNKRDTGQRVLVVGGGMIGLETAEYLADKGKDVTVVEILDEVAGDMEPITRKLLLKSLKSKDVVIRTKTTIQGILKGTVSAKSKNGDLILGEFDTVVIATGVVPENSFEKELRAAGIEFQSIGDAKQPRNIIEAVIEGFEVGKQV
ncbi:MAG: FAD-dependent oxidoreductase [Candidatus Electryonea clarkiae]|nr:FAD-dependent oxidoreductase [Candidatus Electryonea clarkiae]